jgi:opacity protein-like surface antigen
MRRPVTLLSAAVLLTLPAVASAQTPSANSGDCPNGAWFCSDAAPDTSSKVEESADDDVAVDSGPVEKAPPPPPTVVVQRPVPRYEPPPPYARRHHYRSEWGFNMHLLGALMGDRSDRAHDSGMGGVGFALRARPTGYFALDFGLDVVGGRDYYGRRRTEVPLTVNALVFVNPRDRAQFYMLGGLGWSSARVEVPFEYKGANYSSSGSTIDRYGYFGVQLGAGFEFRVAKKTALNVDLIGFVRGRTDQAAAYNPEFTDPATGRRTNTSGGGLLRGGLTFYW